MKQRTITAILTARPGKLVAWSIQPSTEQAPEGQTPARSDGQQEHLERES